MQSNNKDWFHYSYYWRTWSRVVLRGGGTFAHQVEIPLTPINDSEGEWEDIRRMDISRRDVRYAIPDRKDIWTHVLPDDVYERVKEKLGKPNADFMVHSDLMNLIDWNVFNAASKDNGRCPFLRCQKDFKFPWKDMISKPGLHSVVESSKVHFAMKYEIKEVQGTILAGGFSHQTENSHLLFHAEYDTVNSLISFNFNVSTDDGDSITRVSKRSGDVWKCSVIKQLDYYGTMFGFDAEAISSAKSVVNQIEQCLLVLG